MKTLPNGVIIFNSTPHPITFWMEEWDEPVNVECDELINATIQEKEVISKDNERLAMGRAIQYVAMVQTTFVPSQEGYSVIESAQRAGADLIVGSIIAAQAYPGLVVAMTPAPGYERVPPSEKRANPNKYTVFPDPEGELVWE